MNALKPGEMRLYDRCEPVWKAGSHAIVVGQDLSEADPPGRLRVSIAPDPNAVFNVVVVGAADLSGDEVLVAFPTPGCEDAADVMLPHLVLRRRTLPWERTAVPGDDSTPWVALLLFVDDEDKKKAECTLTDNGLQVEVAARLLADILPTREQLPLLCHVRELCRTDRDARKDDDGFVAIVLGNRLPSPGKKHLCCLVSVEKIFQLTLWPETVSLPVLYSWTFKADAAGGDFESRLRNVCFEAQHDPNNRGLQPRAGGVARFAEPNFGHVLLDITTRAGEREPTWYRGPLAPVPLQRDNPPYAEPEIKAKRDEWEAAIRRSVPRCADDAAYVTDKGQLVLSHAAAFELGRMLALGSPESLAQLQDVRARESEEVRTRSFRGWMTLPEGFSKDFGENFGELYDGLLAGELTNLRDEVGSRLLTSPGEYSGIRDMLAETRLAAATPEAITLGGNEIDALTRSVGVIEMDESQLAVKFGNLVSAVLGNMRRSSR